MRRRGFAGARDDVVMSRWSRQPAAKSPGERIDQSGKVERGIEVGRGEELQDFPLTRAWKCCSTA
jgi:hypothetical protein